VTDESSNENALHMAWGTDVQTTIVSVNDTVQVTDVGERVANGSVVKTLTVEDALDLADRHDECGALLRKAARQAWANQQNKQSGKE